MKDMIEEGYIATKVMMPQIKELFKNRKVQKHWWRFSVF
jgi:hypothetical protein